MTRTKIQPATSEAFPRISKGQDFRKIKLSGSGVFPNQKCPMKRVYCIQEYRDFSTAEIGSHRLMNIFLIFISLVPKINRHGLMLCHVMPIRF